MLFTCRILASTTITIIDIELAKKLVWVFLCYGKTQMDFLINLTVSSFPLTVPQNTLLLFFFFFYLLKGANGVHSTVRGPSSFLCSMDRCLRTHLREEALDLSRKPKERQQRRLCANRSVTAGRRAYVARRGTDKDLI